MRPLRSLPSSGRHRLGEIESETVLLFPKPRSLFIAMLVEIKADLTISDINKHIERLEKMRKHADLRGDKRRFLGAVAGIVVEDAEREYALSQGFYLIEPSGENFNITPPHDKPKEW